MTQPLKSTPHSPGALDLVDVIQRLSLARDLASVQDIVRQAARRLCGADGAAFVLRDGDECHYVDEDAIEPLWKGRRFPLEKCISGWAMLNRRPAVIEDVYADDRIPHDAYRPTFVKSLVMMPIRTLDPMGAIGAYWARPHQPTDEEVRLLQALADSTAVALENVRARARTAELESSNQKLAEGNRELRAAQEQSDRVFSAFARALPGMVIDGKYRLEVELGRGGFGIVFRGHHLMLDCPIAVKVFRPAPGNDSGRGLQRFLREGATATHLEHPNAVRVLDSGVSSEGIAYLIMELLHGRSLARELEEYGTLPLPRAAAIAATVASVLAAAHERGILHRDIKPDNIFLHYAAGEEVVKVVDFGIARYFAGPSGPEAERFTRTGEYIMGTPSFVAPERLTGAPDDGRSDVFSLGMTLYQAICGAYPWSREEVIRLGSDPDADVRPTPMGRFRPGVPLELEVLVEQSLARDPASRPTASEFAAALDRLAGSIADVPPRRAATPQKELSTLDVTLAKWPPDTK